MFPALVLLLARRLERADAAVLQRHLWLIGVPWAAALLCLPLMAPLFAKDTPPAAVDALVRGIGVAALVFLVAAAAGQMLLRKRRLSAALALVACGHFGASLIVLASHDTYGQLKSSAAIARALSPQIDAATPVFAVRSYDQTLPFYLRRSVILVDYRDEFEFGQGREPERWIPTLGAFVARWRNEPRAAAYMSRATFDELTASGLALRIVFEDPRRLMVVKP